jgi:LysM repeat protein
VQITSKNKIEGNKFVWNSSCVLQADLTKVEMKKIVKVFGLAVLMSLSYLSGYANTQDSIGTKVKNGKVFILHQVEKSQGLFSISRRYGVTLNDIITANPGSDKMLHVNQILFIPTGKDAALEEKAVTEYFAEDKEVIPVKKTTDSKKTTFAKYHTVANGETLYSISVLYKTKVDVIKNLNGLETDILSPGQQILVPATAVDKTEQDKKLNEVKQELDDVSSKLEKLKEVVKPKEVREDPVIEMSEVVSEKYTVTIERMPKYKREKISETGYVESMEANESNKNKRVCSHHSAAIGSILMISNPVNSKSVFVKVIANHTISEEIGNIVKLSDTALMDIEIKPKSAVNVSFAR